MARFLNDDCKLRNGGRTAPKMSISELKRRLNDTQNGTNHMPDRISHLLYMGTLEKDIKYHIRLENEPTERPSDFWRYFPRCESKNLVGYQTLPNGFTFYGAYGFGVSFNEPFYTIFYYDGKRIRAYTPTYGNIVNVDTKCFLGSTAEFRDSEDIDLDKLSDKYSDAGIIDSYLAIGEDADRAYLCKYGFAEWDNDYIGEPWPLVGPDQETCEFPLFNWEAIKMDIMSRIDVVGEIVSTIPDEDLDDSEEDTDVDETVEITADGKIPVCAYIQMPQDRDDTPAVYITYKPFFYRERRWDYNEEVDSIFTAAKPLSVIDRCIEQSGIVEKFSGSSFNIILENANSMSVKALQEKLSEAMGPDIELIFDDPGFSNYFKMLVGD